MACVARIFNVYASLYVCRGQTVIELVQQKTPWPIALGHGDTILSLRCFLFFCFVMRRARVRCRRTWPKALFLYGANRTNQNNADNHIVLQSHRVHRTLQHQYAEPKKHLLCVCWPHYTPQFSTMQQEICKKMHLQHLEQSFNTSNIWASAKIIKNPLSRFLTKYSLFLRLFSLANPSQ